jgi:MFS family permease
MMAQRRAPLPYEIRKSVQRSEKNKNGAPKSEFGKGVVVLGWVSLLTDIASDMIYPLLPTFLTRALGAGPAVVGLIEGVAESTASLMKVLSGRWSDRIRRRKPLVLAGYTLAGLARPLIGLAASWVQVLAIRFADRVGKGIRTAPRDALLADLASEESRGKAFGLQRAMDNAGAMIGPLLASALLYFWIRDERTVFLLAFIPGMAGVVLLAWKVPERAGAAARDNARATPDSAAPLPREFWISVAIFVVFTLANSTDAFLLLRARQAGVPLWEVPLLWAFLQGVKAASGVPGGMLSDRIGRAGALILGWIVYAAAYAGLALVSSPAILWVLFALYGLFYGLTEGAERALVADLVAPGARGRAFGLFHGAIGIAALPASVLFGLWWKLFGAPAAFGIGAAIALVSAAALLVFRSRLRTPAGASV